MLVAKTTDRDWYLSATGSCLGVSLFVAIAKIDYHWDLIYSYSSLHKLFRFTALCYKIFSRLRWIPGLSLATLIRTLITVLIDYRPPSPTDLVWRYLAYKGSDNLDAVNKTQIKTSLSINRIIFTILFRAYIYAIYVWKIIQFPLRQRYFAVCEHFLAFHSSVGHRQNQSPEIYAPNDRLLFHLEGYADRNDHEVHETYFFHHFCSALE